MAETTVVIVDDDQMVIEPFVQEVRAALPRLRYRVLPLVTQADLVGPAPHPGAVAVCDVALREGPEGAEAVRSLTARGWSVLLFSGSAPDGQILEAIVAGARAFLVKKEPSRTMLEAIAVVSVGGAYLSRGLADIFYKELCQRRCPPSAQLTPIERNILVWVLQGRSLGKAPAAFQVPPAEVQDVIGRIFAAAVARRTLFQLSDRERQIVKMVGCHGESAEQMAEKLGLKTSTINKHLQRIQVKYRDCYTERAEQTPKAAAQFWAHELNLCH